jgi:predicted secreted hydrolase
MTTRPTARPSARRVVQRFALLLAAVPVVGGCDERRETRATISAAGLLAEAGSDGFARVEQPRDLVFPDDHGPHPEYRHEWWYFTGNLESEGGDRFGFQLTFFRNALRPDTAEIPSAWATNQVFMAHFALTDVARARFHAFERFERDALGLAGARPAPLRVHVGAWEARGAREDMGDMGDVGDMAAGREAFGLPVLRLLASEGGVGIDLVVEAIKPVALQGDRGVSPKGPKPGNASYYYSYTRLDARGTVTVDGRPVPVRGLAWMDREWGTSALGPDLDGWDWYAVQLDDGTELVFFRLRRRDGARDPLDSGTFVHADGRTTRLTADDVVTRPTGTWRSPRGGRYPSGWRLEVPRLDLSLHLDPLLPDQELDLTFRYWEGAVSVDGRRGGSPVRGHGYVELTGYDEGDAGAAPGDAGAAPGDAGRAGATSRSSSTRRPKNRSAR